MDVRKIFLGVQYSSCKEQMLVFTLPESNSLVWQVKAIMRNNSKSLDNRQTFFIQFSTREDMLAFKYAFDSDCIGKFSVYEAVDRLDYFSAEQAKKVSVIRNFFDCYIKAKKAEFALFEQCKQSVTYTAYYLAKTQADDIANCNVFLVTQKMYENKRIEEQKRRAEEERNQRRVEEELAKLHIKAVATKHKRSSSGFFNNGYTGSLPLVKPKENPKEQQTVLAMI
jgi:hypothetical protein